jgi:hypothetical protein
VQDSWLPLDLGGPAKALPGGRGSAEGCCFYIDLRKNNHSFSKVIEYANRQIKGPFSPALYERLSNAEKQKNFDAKKFLAQEAHSARELLATLHRMNNMAGLVWGMLPTGDELCPGG